MGTKGLEAACLDQAMKIAPDLFPDGRRQTKATHPGFIFQGARTIGLDVVDYAMRVGRRGDAPESVHEIVERLRGRAERYSNRCDELWLLLAASETGWSVSDGIDFDADGTGDSLLPEILSEVQDRRLDPAPFAKVLVYEASTRQVVTVT